MVFKESSLIKHAFFFQITDAFVAEILPLKICTGAHRNLPFGPNAAHLPHAGICYANKK
jgi:hypothetical protein